VRWDEIMWPWSGTIRNGKGQLVEIGVSHQIRWNILREHNWSVPSVHIKFIYYVCYIYCRVFDCAMGMHVYRHVHDTIFMLGQHHRISWNRHHVGSTRIQGRVRWDWWGDCDWIWSGTIRVWLVEIGTSHQIWWNILREHNWGVPSAHIKFIYYVTYILEYLIMLQGRAHTGMYTIL